jgi:hypothetical protein
VIFIQIFSLSILKRSTCGSPVRASNLQQGTFEHVKKPTGIGSPRGCLHMRQAQGEAGIQFVSLAARGRLAMCVHGFTVNGCPECSSTTLVYPTLNLSINSCITACDMLHSFNPFLKFPLIHVFIVIFSCYSSINFTSFHKTTVDYRSLFLGIFRKWRSHVNLLQLSSDCMYLLLQHLNRLHFEECKLVGSGPDMSWTEWGSCSEASTKHK